MIFIDIALLGFLLVIFAKLDFTVDFMKPISVILLVTVVGIVAGFILDDILWGIPHLVVVVVALYFLIGWFFDIPKKEHRIIVGSFLGVKILVSVIAAFL